MDIALLIVAGMEAREEHGDSGPGDMLARLQRQLEAERMKRVEAEARLQVQLAASDALLAGAFPCTPWIPNLDE